jgi:hypothetical protein
LTWSGRAVSIRIIVKSFEGVVLWSREYRSDDPVLGSLAIGVPLLRPIRLVSPPTRIGKGKKLRGQVVELGKKCKLKDLTVLIQAKADGDTLWRVVGAGTTDSSGSFSLPYPFGVFRRLRPSSPWRRTAPPPSR